jgi:hypothetical protein
MSKAQRRQTWHLNESNGQHLVTNADLMRSHGNPRHSTFIAYTAFDCGLLGGFIIIYRISSISSARNRATGITFASDGAYTNKFKRHRATAMQNDLAVIAVSSASTVSYRITRLTRQEVLHLRSYKAAYDAQMYASRPSVICRILSPKLRNSILQGGIFHRDFPLRLISLQFVQPGRHVC